MAKKAARKSFRAFDDRLEGLGFGVDALSEQLRVPPAAAIRLAARGGGRAPSVWLKPANVVQLKEWIGVPQATVEEDVARFANRNAPRKIDGDGDGAAQARSVARQFLLGDASTSKQVEAKLRFDRYFEIPTWLFLRVEVADGAVLEFGQGTNLLVADEVVIEHGGTIRSLGSLKITCRRITRG